MPARKKSKIVKKPKRIRPKFTLKGVKKPPSEGESVVKESAEKVEEKQESENELASVVQSPTPSAPESVGIQPEPKPQEPSIDTSPQPFVPVGSPANTVPPPQTQFSASPPPSQFVVSSTAADASAPQSSVPPSTPVSESAEKPIIESVSEKKARSWVFPLILFLIFLLGLGGGLFYFFYYLKGDIQKLPFTTPVETKITSTPSPSIALVTEIPKVAVNLSEYEIRILNGSGIAGEAGKVRALLEKEGFIVSDTANAEKYDYEETVIEAREGVKKAFIDKLASVLGQSYVVASDTASLVGENVDVIVIVGSKK